MKLVRSLPDRLIVWIACGMAYPSKIGTAWVTPSPESNTVPVVLPVAKRLKTD